MHRGSDRRSSNNFCRSFSYNGLKPTKQHIFRINAPTIISFISGFVFGIHCRKQSCANDGTKLVELVLSAAIDLPIVETVELSRQATGYKSRFGVGEDLHKYIVEHLKQHQFSLNIDEATAKTRKKVLALLVAYINQVSKQLEVQHLAAVEVILRYTI